MSDLSDIQSALPVKLIGSSATGVETNPLTVSAPGDSLTNATGILLLGSDATTLRALLTDTSGRLLTDPIDRAARLLGVVYGSQGAQLKQTATNFNLAAEIYVGGSAIDPRSIRALTSSDVVDVADRAARLLGVVYGSQSQQLKQTATNFNLAVETYVAGSAIDPRSIRALTTSDAISATLAAETTKVIGTVNQGTSPWVVSGSVTTGGLTDTQLRASAVPVSLASVPTHGVTVASGGVASGAIASGAVASGAFASGSVASGAIASGAIAAGAIASGAAVSGAFADGAIVTLGAKTDAKSTATDNTSITIMQVLKEISAMVQAPPFGGVEDAAETAGGLLAMAGSVRRDTAASSAGTTGDNATINTDASGCLWTDPQGNVAHDAVDTGNPIKIGAIAVSTLATATLVSAADRTNCPSDLDGVQLMRFQVPLGDILSGSVVLTSTSPVNISSFGAVAGTKNYITKVTIWNGSAVDTYVYLVDGSGGSAFWVSPAPSKGGCCEVFNIPLKQPTANTDLYVSVAATANPTWVSVLGFKSKIS